MPFKFLFQPIVIQLRSALASAKYSASAQLSKSLPLPITMERKKTPVRIIQAQAPAWSALLRELWRYRSLIGVFAQRDYRARFAQTALGYLWALLQPLLGVAVLYLVFQRMLGAATEGVGFFAYSLSGLLLWNFFSFTSSQGASALIQAQAMLQKIYFPRMVLPLSKNLLALVDLAVALLLFLVVAQGEASFKYAGFWLLLPALFLVAAAATGLALWLSALSVRYRDLQQVVPIFLQLLFFLSPIAYAPALQSELLGAYAWVAQVNPLSGPLSLLRSGLFGLPLNPHWAYSVLSSMLLLVSGAWYFGRVERKMADLI